MTDGAQEKTGLGNYFVANYPPFSAWTADHLPAAQTALATPPRADTPLGLYLHIPFCRKRCKFCYFRVYTDKNARDVEVYLEALLREVELYRRQPIVGDRNLQFIYFGGGTPSYLSAPQLKGLVERLQSHFPWDKAAEVTFECEPGTLQQHKLEMLRQVGVTRLSLGIENFDDKILEANGRAHLSAEIYRAYGWARELNFPQINIDLIAGMVGETWENWRVCVQKTIELAPDSVTVYQMELPYNTVYSKELAVIANDPKPRDEPGTPGESRGCSAATLIADWPTKRAWVDYAFNEFAKAGYTVSSAYTVVRDPARTKFVYRDSLWHGADMFGTGVASFGHVGGVHVQNVDTWEKYVEMLDQGQLPLGRALAVAPKQRLLREMMLQLKTGRLEAGYFQTKFGADILRDFDDGFRTLQQEGFLTIGPGEVRLTRPGLLQIDRLLPTFFEAEYRGTRYVGATGLGPVAQDPTRNRILLRGIPCHRAKPGGSSARALLPGAMADSLTFNMGKFPAVLPGELRRTRNHMWCRPAEACLRFGFTSYAVRLMQDVYFLDWEMSDGTPVEAKQQIGHIETSKAMSDLFAPLAGTIVRFNPDLLADPSGINVDNYGAGWLFEITGDEADTLSAQEYYDFLDANWEKTQNMLKGHM